VTTGKRTELAVVLAVAEEGAVVTAAVSSSSFTVLYDSCAIIFPLLSLSMR
jgi:hypothetical protein